MSDLESRIQESYERLHIGTAVYLLRDESAGYGELPNPDTSNKVFKAGVAHIDPAFRSGISVIRWPDFQPPSDEADESLRFVVSPREVFKPGELKTVLYERTTLPKIRLSKLDRYINSKSGAFGSQLATEMARVILERFSEDPRDSSGHLIKR